VVPFIEGTRILEIGHGPGHLQRFILSQNLDSVAMDESTAPSSRDRSVSGHCDAAWQQLAVSELSGSAGT
jgi:hypothetical protein